MRQQLTNLEARARQPKPKLVHPNYQKVRSHSGTAKSAIACPQQIETWGTIRSREGN
ncbi:hypothetical protein [Scytonema sp. PCC 10023]|uniref:hypothetical protein n=1 Tax=Scytonema sp. PCC 10023 TaxID=1680591 RepID=UPI0039C618B3